MRRWRRRVQQSIPRAGDRFTFEQYQEILASMRFKELLDACQKAEKRECGRI